MFEATNLRLKTGTLDELGLPISVKRGFLKSLIIRIHITTFNVYIKGNGLFLLVYPQHSSEHFDFAAHQRQQIAIKESLLNAAEKRMLCTEWDFLNEQASKAQEWFNYLTKHFIRTVKMDIGELHIRYQDLWTIPGHPFVVGLTLKHLTAINDEENEQKEQEQISKKVAFESLSIYLNCRSSEQDIIWNEEILSNGELIKKFEQIPSKTYRCKHYDYILSPLSLSFIMHIHEHIELFIHRNPSNESAWRPRIECKINVDRLKMEMTQKQLNTVQLWQKWWKYVAAKIELKKVLHKMKKRRPPKFEQKKNEKLWWQYVSQCIIALHQNAKNRANEKGESNKKNSKIDWNLILNFSKNKEKYCSLYKRKMRPSSIKNWLPELSEDEQSELSEMELNELPIDQILIFRSLAIAELKEEMNKRTDFIEQRNKDKAEESKDSYLVTRMLWNAGNYAKSAFVDEEEDPSKYKLSDTERAKMIQLIDFEQNMQKMKLPNSYVKYRCALIFESISINLKTNNKSQSIASLTIKSKLQFQARPRSNLIGVSFQCLDLKSSFDADACFKSIICSYSSTKTEESERKTVSKEDTLSTKGVNAASLKYYHSDRVPSPFDWDDLIQIEFETNPLSSTADSRIAINISPIQFVWNVEWIKRLQTFFDISHIDIETLNNTGYSSKNPTEVRTTLGFLDPVRTPLWF